MTATYGQVPLTPLKSGLRLFGFLALISVLPLWRLAINTVGNLTLVGDSVLVGVVILGPPALRILKRKSPEFREMCESRERDVWAIRFVVVFVLSVFCYDLALGANGAFLNSAPYLIRTDIVHRSQGADLRARTYSVDLYDPRLGGFRELHLTKAAWDSLAGDSSLLLVLKRGRLGFPLIVGYRRIIRAR